MSTKIYYGFRINSGNLMTVHEILEKFKPRANELAEEKLKTFLENGETTGSWHSRRREMRKTNQTDYAVDTDFTIFLLPYRHYILGIPECVTTDWIYEFQNSDPRILEYGYWNNSDKPDNISSREWKTREKAWDKLPYGNIKDNMYRLELVSEFGPLPPSLKKYVR